jgi:hypothetical protein
MVAGDGSVGAEDFFRAAVSLRAVSGYGDVLTDWEAEDGGLGWEGEAVPMASLNTERSIEGKVNLHCYIVRDCGLFGELEIL